jgi:ribosomal protein S18 acetylase RimI-like enzyme
MSDSQRVPAVTVREATAADNESLIRLELESPVVFGDVEETADHSPDYFASHGVQGEYRVVLGEVEGRAVGVMAGAMQAPLVRGRRHRLAYIQQARVHPEFLGRRVAWEMANALFAWAAERGGEGPYYLISPENERSLEFVERGGRRWPVDVTLVEIDVSGAEGGGAAEPVPEDRLGEVVALVNASHAGEEMFEPLTVESLSERLGRDSRYGSGSVFGVFEGGRLAAAGGLWDKGATTERIQRNRSTGETVRTRSGHVVDWGRAQGAEEAFGELLRRLASEARALGRTSLLACEPRPGAMPDIGLAARRFSLGLFTPTLEPPPSAEGIGGLWVDLLYV